MEARTRALFVARHCTETCARFRAVVNALPRTRMLTLAARCSMLQARSNPSTLLDARYRGNTRVVTGWTHRWTAARPHDTHAPQSPLPPPRPPLLSLSQMLMMMGEAVLTLSHQDLMRGMTTCATQRDVLAMMEMPAGLPLAECLRLGPVALPHNMAHLVDEGAQEVDYSDLKMLSNTAEQHGAAVWAREEPQGASNSSSSKCARVAQQQQQQQLQQQQQKQKQQQQSSRFTGVSRDQDRSRCARVQVTSPQSEGQQFVGRYASEEEAARAHDCAVRESASNAVCSFPSVAGSTPVAAGGKTQPGKQPDPKSTKAKQPNSSRFQGVTWDANNSTWRMQLWDPDARCNQTIGRYANETEAARAYDKAAVAARGPDAARNQAAGKASP
jgi:hypothetical protein